MNRNDLINKWIREVNQELLKALSERNSKRAEWLEELRKDLVNVREKLY